MEIEKRDPLLAKQVTARDMLRWDRALRGNSILSDSARRELFAPRVRESPGEFYAYGWNILKTPIGPLAIHNGGNGWSFAVLARSLVKPIMVFWVSNHAYEAGSWNLEPLESTLTAGLFRRLNGSAFASRTGTGSSSIAPPTPTARR